MRSSILLILAILAVASHAQDFPENPGDCNPNTCEGCVTYLPKPGNETDFRCGVEDVYFAVPVSIVRNNTSAAQELTPRQWLCVPCCISGCGFNNGSSVCKNDDYGYPTNGNVEFGCTKCAGSTTKNPTGGTVKSFFEDLSTSSVYKVENMPWTSKFLTFPSIKRTNSHAHHLENP